MATILKGELPEMPGKGKFTGCDGKEWSDDLLKFHLAKAIEEENYVWANECNLELERRKALNMLLQSKLIPVRKDAVPFNDSLHPAFSWINEWAIERRGCTHYLDDCKRITWVNDYTEYTLEFDDFAQECRLMACNVEIRNSILFYVPVGQTEGYFDNLMSLLGHG